MSNTMLDRVTLEKIKYIIVGQLDKRMIEPDVDVSLLEAFTESVINVRVRAMVWGEPVGEEKVISFPRDWWQAFKKRWFPKFALRLWPVIYTEHHIETKAYYPDFRPSLPEQGYGFQATDRIQ